MPGDEAVNPDQRIGSTASVDDRLVRLFEATFPELPSAVIPSATVDSVEEWDSLQSVVLMTLVEEEFGIAISPLDLPELGSYQSFREYLVAAGGQ